MTGVRLAFVDVDFAPGAREPLRAIARKTARSVHANSVVLARRPLLAFIDIFRTIDPFVSRGTAALIRTIYGTGIAYCVGVARIARTSIVEMAQKSGFPGRALAIETANPVDARGAVKARRACAIVDVFRTVRPLPSVDADARVAADAVRARRAVLTDRRAHRAFVDVLLAMRARVRRRTLTRVAVDAVDARGAVQALVSRAIVDVLLAIRTTET